MGNPAIDMARRFASSAKERIVEIEDESGELQTFKLRGFSDVAEFTDSGKRMQGRVNAFTIAKKKLAVLVDSADVEGLESFFPDLTAVEDKPGKSQFYLTDVKQVQIATALETSVIEPAMSWPAAAVYVRVCGPVAMRLMKEISIATGMMENEKGEAEPLDDAKND